MTRPGITYQDVVKAVESIINKGQKPTILGIREELGGIGSTTTISKFYKQWKAAMQSNTHDQNDDNHAKNDTSSSMQQTAYKASSNSEAKHSSKTEQMQEKAHDHEKTIPQDPDIAALINNAENISNEILNFMNDEWQMITNEQDSNIKIKKLQSALLKEQTRRDVAEKMAREAKVYADLIKEQFTQRISDLKENMESQISFLNNQIRNLEQSSEKDLAYYRELLDKANKKIISLKQQQG